MERLGVFGGRFDPPHTAHLIHARLVLERFALEEVLFVPAAHPPHKEVHASFSDRAEMVRLAIKDEESCFTLCDIEWKENLSYTVETLGRLRVLYPDHRLFLIIGRDEYECLSTWREPERIQEMAELVVLPRGSRGAGKDTAGLHFPDLPILEISSTAVRERVAQGRSIAHWVPSAVEAYIRKRRLYKENA